MKKSPPPITVSKLSNNVNYTLSLANLINIINWLKLTTIKLAALELCTGLTLIYLLLILAGLGRIVGVI